MSTHGNALAYDGPMAAELLQEPVIELTRMDRCDRCGAQAYVRATLVAGVLLFCAHHGREHMPKLITLEGVTIHDESDKLLRDVTAQKMATDAV